jgi:hypothetical protein
MGKLIKIGLIFLLAIVAGARISAQTVNVVVDTSKVRVEGKAAVTDPAQKGAKPDVANQAQQGNQARNAADNNPSKAVKQVKSGRPDLSKAKGARPPVIIRPTGTTIPKGVGKPAGVGKKGGR